MFPIPTVCYGGQNPSGHSMTAGTLSVTGNLCSSDLFFSPQDQDGRSTCAADYTWGPAWSTSNNDGCPLDDPVTASIGPHYSSVSTERAAIGFGGRLGLNTGTAGAAQNYLQMYVRE